MEEPVLMERIFLEFRETMRLIRLDYEFIFLFRLKSKEQLSALREKRKARMEYRVKKEENMTKQLKLRAQLLLRLHQRRSLLTFTIFMFLTLQKKRGLGYGPKSPVPQRQLNKKSRFWHQ